MMNSSIKNKYDNSFDLDEYIEEQAAEELNQPEVLKKPRISQFKRNLIALLLFFVLPLVLIIGSGLYSSDPVSFRSAPPIAPPPSAVPPAVMSSSYIDYLTEIKEAGLGEYYSSSGYQGLYNGGVPIEYLKQMSEAGYLDEFSYSAVIGLYNGGVTIDYLNQLSEADYLDDFSYSAVIGLYNGGVTIEYLNAMKAGDYLDAFSYSGIIGLNE